MTSLLFPVPSIKVYFLFQISFRYRPASEPEENAATSPKKTKAESKSSKKEKKKGDYVWCFSCNCICLSVLFLYFIAISGILQMSHNNRKINLCTETQTHRQTHRPNNIDMTNSENIETLLVFLYFSLYRHRV